MRATVGLARRAGANYGILGYNSSSLEVFPFVVLQMQNEKAYQRFMMTTLEKIAKHYEMNKLILTVVSNNEGRLTFFNSLGFSKNESSPDAVENIGYEILSK